MPASTHTGEVWATLNPTGQTAGLDDFRHRRCLLPTDHEASVPLAKGARVVDAHRMRFIGVDLAWADSAVANETGVVALDDDGTVVAAGWTTGVAATTAWLEANAGEEAIPFIDAPLVVLNETKQRLCEKQVGQRYGRWKVSANSTNRASPRLAGVLLREVLEQRGWAYDDGVGGGRPDADRSFSECYPYTTLVGAEEFGYQQERPLYKRKPRGVSAARWRPLRAAGCDELIKRLDLLREASPPLHLRSHPTTSRPGGVGWRPGAGDWRSAAAPVRVSASVPPRSRGRAGLRSSSASQAAGCGPPGSPPAER
jgi:hypothetical protein